MSYFDKIVKEEEMLYVLLEDVNLVDLGFGIAEKILFITVQGDWKHDHLRCQYLLEEEGYRMISKRVTEEDGSDWYTAEYTFRKVA